MVVVRPRLETVDSILARLATESHGIVTRRQLREAGVTEGEIKQRVRSGALLREHRGVYRVGHRAPSVEARYLAAVKACGDEAALCGPAAGHIWGLVRGRAPEPEVLVAWRREVTGLKTRQCRKLDPRDVTCSRGMPITSVPRTLVDLAAALSPQALSRACHEAGVRYRTTPAQVEAVLARRPNSPGAAKLRRIIRGEERITLSELEARFLERLREAGLPLPKTNRPAGGHRVDCRWPEHGLTVELDSYRFHASRHAWEQDRHRERQAHARGDEFRRYTWGDVFERPRLMLRELRALLPIVPAQTRSRI
jgi:hypothetical protein